MVSDVEFSELCRACCEFIGLCSEALIDECRCFEDEFEDEFEEELDLDDEVMEYELY